MAAGTHAPAKGWGKPTEHTAEAFRVRVEPDPVPVPLADETDAEAKGGEPLLGDEEHDIPYTYFWGTRDGLAVRAAAYVRGAGVSRNSPGLLAAFELPDVETPAARWRPAPPPASPLTRNWSFGATNWQTRFDEGPKVLGGSSEIAVPAWNEGVRLGGVSLSQSFIAGNEDVARWNYSLAFGAVDQSAAGQSGDLAFGPKAGSASLTYHHGSGLSLSSHTQVADDLMLAGVTSQYDLGILGRWRSGVARSNKGLNQGWRYRAMADFAVADDMSLAWMGERHTAGFMDIRRYADAAAPVAGGRQRWSASWDAGRWGEWSGSFESVHGDQGVLQRRFGVTQEFWYSPRLRIGIHAEREVIADDYDIGLRFSFPLY